MAAWEFLARIVVAGAVGGTIGLERELRGRAAGLRTHILVCAGAAVVMAVAEALGQPDGPGRALAGIVTGVGFLGAGAIVKTGDIVRGLTTAACIWFVAALGVVVGQGLYVLGAGSTALALFVLVTLNRVERWIPALTYHTVAVRAELAEAAGLEERCRAVLAAAGYRVLAVDLTLDRAEHQATLVLHVRVQGTPEVSRVAQELLAMPEVIQVKWG
ncbi:MAG: MgtC/SapB family protein [Candidatus Acetothermia bacterium]|nr:MgtC/SapB family protein [Candidatus Acetothermia bacterium]